eukprot:560346_1
MSLLIKLLAVATFLKLNVEACSCWVKEGRECVEKELGGAVDCCAACWGAGHTPVFTSKADCDSAYGFKPWVKSIGSCAATFQKMQEEQEKADKGSAAADGEARVELMDQYYYDEEVEAAREELALKRLKRERARASVPR